MTTPVYLLPDELIAITGYRQKGAQARWLKGQKIQHRMKSINQGEIMKKLFLSLVIAASLTGCAVPGVGQEFTWQQVETIKPGMTLANVTTVLGPPMHSAMTAQGTIITWVYVPPPVPFQKSDTRQVSITFKDGKVADFPM